MLLKWTEEQQKVIDLRDRNILVSAAAGSGKTAVLVERIISRITDESDPADVDRLLVVTYTEAAAAEMKEAGRTAGKCESGAAVHIDSQCVDHDDPQFLLVGDPGSFSCDRD